MLHRRVGRHGNDHVPVFLERIGAEGVAEKGDHLRQVDEVRLCVGELPGVHEILDGQVSRLLQKLYVWPRGEPHHIGGYVGVAAPVVRAGAVPVVRDAGADSVGCHQPVFPHGDVPVHQSLFPGMVIAGPPIASGIRVGEGVDAVWGKDHADVIRRGAAVGDPGVVDRGGEGSLRHRERDVDDAVLVGEGRGLAIHQHAVHLQRIAFQFIVDAVKVLQGVNEGGHAALDVAGLVVDLQVHHIFADVKSGEGIRPFDLAGAGLHAPERLGGGKGGDQASQQGQAKKNTHLFRVHKLLFQGSVRASGTGRILMGRASFVNAFIR